MVEKDEMYQRNEQTINAQKILYAFGITFIGCYSAYAGVIYLQSSMNVEEGLGTKSVMTTFITSSISSLVLVPYMIDFLGAKAAIIIGEIGFLVYIAANFYPSWYTLIPASVFHGLTESAPWAGSFVYISHLAELRWMQKRNRLKSKESYIYRYFSQFVGMTAFADLFGSGIVAIVLLAFQDIPHQPVEKNENYTSIVSSKYTNKNYTTTFSTVAISQAPMAACGSSDCPATYAYNATKEELEKYIPNPKSIYILLTFFVAMCATCIIVQIIYLPRASAKFDRQTRKLNTNLLEMKGIIEENDNTQSPSRVSTLENIRKELRDIFMHLISPLHLLVMVLFIYFGMHYGFMIADFTRAFVSCTVGVEQIGVSVIVGSTGGIVVSVLSARILPLIGRRWFVVGIGICHLSFYIASLMWKPEPSNIWLIYMFSLISAFCSFTMETFQNGLVAVLFEDRKGIALASRNSLSNIGIAFVTGLSVNMCVYTKIYIQIGTLSVALLLLVAAELIYERSIKHKKALGDFAI